jgi:probable rRNA maturation factor
VTTIDVVIEDARWERLKLTPLATRTVEAGLRKVGVPDGFEIALLACDDATIAKLNEDFRGKPVPTNVLSWPAQDLAPLQPGEAPASPEPPGGFDDSLGDIALAYDTCAREAEAQGKPFEHHITHLILHGTLHLLGYDHETDADAALMERTETEILAELGIPDPYSFSAAPEGRA